MLPANISPVSKGCPPPWKRLFSRSVNLNNPLKGRADVYEPLQNKCCLSDLQIHTSSCIHTHSTRGKPAHPKANKHTPQRKKKRRGLVMKTHAMGEFSRGRVQSQQHPRLSVTDTTNNRCDLLWLQLGKAEHSSASCEIRSLIPDFHRPQSGPSLRQTWHWTLHYSCVIKKKQASADYEQQTKCSLDRYKELHKCRIWHQSWLEGITLVNQCRTCCQNWNWRHK